MEAFCAWVVHGIASLLVLASPGADEERPPRIKLAPTQEDIPRLRKQLTDTDPAARLRAAQYLASPNLGPEAKRAVPDLILLLKDEKSDVRIAAASIEKASAHAKDKG
jgi:HEAT repeat protein